MFILRIREGEGSGKEGFHCTAALNCPQSLVYQARQPHIHVLVCIREGEGSGEEGWHSAFVPASREGWAQALYNAKDPVAAALLSDVPSLAGSLPR